MTSTRLDALLAAPGAQRTMVVTDVAFSMDGDVADLAGIGERCHRHGSLLVIDEAHAVLQPRPDDDLAPVVLTVGTLSKALGALGGFVAGPRPFTDLLVNRARSYIFTTAASPADAAAALAAVAIVDSPEGDALRGRLRAHVERVAPGHATPIVPVRPGRRTRLRRRIARLLADGPPRPGHPSPDRRPRDQPAAHRPVRRPHRRPGRSTDHRVGRPDARRRPAQAELPMRSIVVVGTGTEVGKTWVSAHVLRDLRAHGLDVAARKPAQSFAPNEATTDAHELARATGEEPSDVCPRHRWYPIPMAPPMAADALGRPPFTIADLAAETIWPVPPPAVGLVETAGGVRSPHAADGDAVTLIEVLQPDIVILVADAGLGMLNSVRLSLEALDRGAHVATPIVFLNRFDAADDLHLRNRVWLDEHLQVEVLVTISSLVTRLRPV